MGRGNSRTKSTAADTAVVLPADCRMAFIAPLRDQLLASFDAAPVKLDAAAVEKIDTAGVQLLAAFHRDAKDRGCDVSWISPSVPLRDAAQRLGLTNVLALPAVTLA